MTDTSTNIPFMEDFQEVCHITRYNDDLGVTVNFDFIVYMF